MLWQRFWWLRNEIHKVRDAESVFGALVADLMVAYTVRYIRCFTGSTMNSVG